MRGLVLAGVGTIELRDDLPDARVETATDAVVRVSAAGLCGSDLHPYLGREAAATGVVQGHEAVGVVVDVGPDVSAVTVGDRVLVPFTTSCGTCPPCLTGLSSRCVRGRLFGWGAPGLPASALPGTQAELLRVPLADGTLVRVPEGVSDLDALLLCDNLPTGWYAASRGGVRDGSEVLVVGLGAVGLCAVTAALALGATEVLALDPLPERRLRAERLGAVATTAEEVAPGSVDVAIEAAGPPDAQRLAARAVRPGGSLSVVAVQTADVLGIDPADAYDRNLTVRFGRTPVRSVLDVLLPRVAAGVVAVPTDEVVSESDVPLARGPEAYQRFARRRGDVLKIAFDPRT